MVTEAARPRRWPRRIAQVLLGVLCAVLIVAGVIAVGKVARQSLGPHDRYLVRFTEIECPAPPGQDRLEFLGEVQYTGAFPDQINVLDPALPERLRAAFAKHPRVQKVGVINVIAPRRVIVELTFVPLVAYDRALSPSTIVSIVRSSHR